MLGSVQPSVTHPGTGSHPGPPASHTLPSTGSLQHSPMGQSGKVSPAHCHSLGCPHPAIIPQIPAKNPELLGHNAQGQGAPAVPVTTEHSRQVCKGHMKAEEGKKNKKSTREAGSLTKAHQSPRRPTWFVLGCRALCSHCKTLNILL